MRTDTKTAKITQKAVEIIKSLPNGLRYSELVRRLKEEFPDTPENTIHGTIWDLHARLPTEIYKPARGLFRHLSFKDGKEQPAKEEPLKARKVSEGDFYKSFAEWLVNDLEECTKAMPLGGNKFKDKWGTPDVIGKLESRPSDILKGPTEIVSAEIKLDSGSLIEAFGQASAYKLFSHKSYLVVPKTSTEEDLSRLDSLCRIFGIGLVLFDSGNSSDPQFEIRVRAAKHDPDLFYTNTYLKSIEKELF